MFFCEACGKPVALKASKCPHCGRLFDSVKCPKCSFSGRPELFTDGCPSCGYLKRSGRAAAASAEEREAAFAEIEDGLVSPETEGLTLGLDRQGSSGPEKKSRRSNHLPNWAYTLLTAVLVVLLIVFVIVYIRL